MSPVDAVVVGAGPNGLAAAVVLAAAGLQVEVLEAAPTIGGGARTSELTLPGFRHDVCSAVHPMGVASPFFRAFDLPRRGVEMLQPDVAYAQPLDGGRAGLAWRDLDRTAAGLGVDGDAWRTLIGPLAARWESLVDVLLSDFRSVPRDLPARSRPSPGASSSRAARRGTAASAVTSRPPCSPASARTPSPHRERSRRPERDCSSARWRTLRAGRSPAAAARPWSTRWRRSSRRTAAPSAPATRCGRSPSCPRPARCCSTSAPAGCWSWRAARCRRRTRGGSARFRYGSAVCKVDFALSEPVPWAAPGLRARRHPAPRRHARGDGRHGGRRRRRAPPEPPVRHRQPARCRRPDAGAVRAAHAVGVRARAGRLHPRPRRGGHRPGRALRTGLPRRRPAPFGDDGGAGGAAQRQLRRR